MTHPRLTWRRRIQPLHGMLALLVLVPVLYTLIMAPGDHWRGTYRSGGPDSQWLRMDSPRLRLHRGHRAWPLPFEPARAADHFEARWISCLRLEEPTELIAQLSFLGQARLSMDGQRMIDAWTLPPGAPVAPQQRPERSARSRSFSRSLDAGSYLIEIDFRGRADRAWIALDVSTKGQVPTAIPLSMLSLPDAGSAARCAN